jgi:hypothetical protein
MTICICLFIIENGRRQKGDMTDLVNKVIYVCIICFIRVKLTFVQDRYTEELRKTYCPDIDPMLVPFDVNTAYHAGGRLPHGRYVKSH